MGTRIAVLAFINSGGHYFLFTVQSYIITYFACGGAIMDPSDTKSSKKLPDATIFDADVPLELIRTITDHYHRTVSRLLRAADEVASRLNAHPAVHMAAARALSDQDIIAKLVRIASEGDEAALDVNRYQDYFDSFVHVTCLFADQKDWLPVHHFLNKTFLFARRPQAALKTSDPYPLRKTMEQAGCDTVVSDSAIRGIDYYLANGMYKQSALLTIHCRTIIEELRALVTSQIKEHMPAEPLLEYHLALFNELSESANQQITHLFELKHRLKTDPRLAKGAASISEASKRLQKALDTPGIPEPVKETLAKEVAAIRQLALDDPGLASVFARPVPSISLAYPGNPERPVPPAESGDQEFELTGTQPLPGYENGGSEEISVRRDSADFPSGGDNDDMNATIYINPESLKRNRNS